MTSGHSYDNISGLQLLYEYGKPVREAAKKIVRPIEGGGKAGPLRKKNFF